MRERYWKDYFRFRTERLKVSHGGTEVTELKSIKLMLKNISLCTLCLRAILFSRHGAKLIF